VWERVWFRTGELHTTDSWNTGRKVTRGAHAVAQARRSDVYVFLVSFFPEGFGLDGDLFVGEARVVFFELGGGAEEERVFGLADRWVVGGLAVEVELEV
jgi:hypothetical protein